MLKEEEGGKIQKKWGDNMLERLVSICLLLKRLKNVKRKTITIYSREIRFPLFHAPGLESQVG